VFSVTGPVCGWLSGFCVEVPLVFVVPCPALGYKTFCSEGFLRFVHSINILYTSDIRLPGFKVFFGLFFQ